MTSEEIFEAWYDKVYGFILFRTGNILDAEDLASDVFVYVVENLRAYDPNKGAISTWLFAIALNKVRMYFRKKKATVEPVEAQEIVSLMDVESDFIRKEELFYLYQAIDNLDARQKEIVFLKYFGGLSTRQIAEVMGLSETNVDVKLHRARTKLKKFLIECKIFDTYANNIVERLKPKREAV